MKHLIWAVVWVACFGSGCSSTTKGTGLPEDAGPHRGGKPAMRDDAGSIGGSGGSPDATSAGDSGGVVVGSGGSLHADASSGGDAGDAVSCELVTHDNGLGQTWQDCEPLYTFNLDQALKACEASSVTACFRAERCGVGEVRGLIGDGAVFAEWGYEGPFAGLVSPNYNLCGGSGDPVNRQWK